jgi:hypothetical protein
LNRRRLRGDGLFGSPKQRYPREEVRVVYSSAGFGMSGPEIAGRRVGRDATLNPLEYLIVVGGGGPDCHAIVKTQVAATKAAVDNERQARR